jgi:hypothetical protein
VANPFQSAAIKAKIKETNVKRYGFDNPAKNEDVKRRALDQYYETIKEKFESGNYNKSHGRSSLEVDFENKLKSENIAFQSPYILDGKKFDFYIDELETIVEIDGEAFHKDRLENLSLINVSSAINDFSKNEIVKRRGKNLQRIRWNVDATFRNVSELKSVLSNLEYTPDYSVTFRQKICTKEYFRNYIYTHGKDKLSEYVYLLVKFLRTFCAGFPTVTADQSIDDILRQFSSFDHNSISNQTEYLSHRCPKTANYFLKSIFVSYWKSAYKNRMSPAEAWKDIAILKDVVAYRIGLNTSNEIFDFSLYEIVKGLSARRLTTSFFNPFLAYSIYKDLLGESASPTVIDPCCGYGGRLLGFKMAYPTGTYIGCEPNKETFDELQKLAQMFGWNNVTIHNINYQDFIPPPADLIFTSIPYFDVETYSNGQPMSRLEWSAFIQKVIAGDNTYVNVSLSLADELGWSEKLWRKIASPTSHYNKNENIKFEGIYKLSDQNNSIDI